ncbi:MAG: 3-dehydroquinate synthase [Alicyclobacillaceae bacterium]|nr:3-dehydroquinate synthase [Alicyclobacillaceae bacterium]
MLNVRASSGSYPVEVAPGLLDAVGERLRALGAEPGTGAMVVTDESVDRLGYARRVAESCQAAGFAVTVAAVPPGDASKSLAMAELLYNRLLDAGVRRNGTVLAVGGGVVGDLAGFVAATYQRGVRFAQVPTTLLAHDSSIGGKVGVNLPRAKNLVGAFYPPAAVLYDVEVLRSLPAREWRSGMAEVIKHAVIGDPELFAELADHPVLECPPPERAVHLVSRAAAVKVKVVEQDERESGLRMVLNLGHTVGHAVEQVSRYELAHGEAVSIGIAVEAFIAVARGWLDERDRLRIKDVLTRHGLPTTPPDYPLAEVLEALGYDKKHGAGGGWTFVLPRAVGDVAVARDVRRDEVEAAWENARKEGA